MLSKHGKRKQLSWTFEKQATWTIVSTSLVPSRPRRFRMRRHGRRHLSSLSGKFAYRARFQASSGHSDSANSPGYEAVYPPQLFPKTAS